MNRILQWFSTPPAPRRMRGALKRKAACELLEGRALLSGGLGMLPGMGVGATSGHVDVGGPIMMYPGLAGPGGGMMRGGMDKFAKRFVDSSTWGGGTHVFRGHGPILPAAARSAMQKLQTDLKADVPAGAKPSQAAISALQADMTAIRQGTLTGPAAQTQVATDQAAVLASMGLTPSQVAQITADQQAVQTAMHANGVGPFLLGAGMGQPPSGAPWGGSTAVSAAMKTVQADLKADIPSGATPSQTTLTTLHTDLISVRSGTITGAAADAQIKTDAAAVLASMGVTEAQTAQIQTDEQALQTAMAAAKPAGATAPAGVTAAVGVYLMGLQGPGGFGRFHP